MKENALDKALNHWSRTKLVFKDLLHPRWCVRVCMHVCECVCVCVCVCVLWGLGVGIGKDTVSYLI